MIFEVLALSLEALVGLLVIGAGVYGFVLNRRTGEALRRARSDAAMDAALQRWRVERRRELAEAMREWQRDFDALLPPAPPCTSTDHNHVDDARYGDQTWRRICVIRPPYSQGGAVLAPSEYVFGISSVEAARRMFEAFGRRGAQ